MSRSAILITLLCLIVLITACDVEGDESVATSPAVPEWAHDAVFYQIFPERFRDGDPSNNPTRETMELPVERVPESWTVRSWTSDWYARDEWEVEMSEDFYEPIFDRRYGGDLQGVIDRLDYLQDLGINTIYFNPIFWARSLHKYDGNSFHHIEPHFGPDPAGDLALMQQEDPTNPDTWVWTEADLLFLQLLDEAHERGIRVIIDGVFNHTGRDFFAFADLWENQEESEFRDWYVVRRFEDPEDPESTFEYDGWWGYERLPEFAENEDNTNLHDGPRAYIMHATSRWMQPEVDGEPRRGVDGWRLDVTEEVPVGFWKEWNAHVRDLNPDAYTVTEIWGPADEYIGEGGFSATMNYYAFAYPVKGFLVDNTLTPSGFAELLDERRELYPRDVQYAMQNLIDSHDTERVGSMIVNADEEPYEQPYRFDYNWGEATSPRWNPAYDVHAPAPEERDVQKLVALFQMTYVGAPMIYYGTEAGMWGADDPDDRKPMVWPDMDYEVEASDPLGRERNPDPVEFDSDLFAYYQSLTSLRHDHEALRRGDYDVIFTDDDLNIFAFERTLNGEGLAVVINRSEEAHSIRIPVAEGTYTDLEPVFSTVEAGYRVQHDGETLLLELPERAGMVLQR